jgi:hypothetical protein
MTMAEYDVASSIHQLFFILGPARTGKTVAAIELCQKLIAVHACEKVVVFGSSTADQCLYTQSKLPHLEFRHELKTTLGSDKPKPNILILETMAFLPPLLHLRTFASHFLPAIHKNKTDYIICVRCEPLEHVRQKEKKDLMNFASMMDCLIVPDTSHLTKLVSDFQLEEDENTSKTDWIVYDNATGDICAFQHTVVTHVQEPSMSLSDIVTKGTSMIQKRAVIKQQQQQLQDQLLQLEAELTQLLLASDQHPPSAARKAAVFLLTH